MSFAQGVPSVNTLINSSNTQVFGNTSTGTALSVQQLGSGAVMNVATSTGTSALFVTSAGNVGVGVTTPVTPITAYSSSGGGNKISFGSGDTYGILGNDNPTNRVYLQCYAGGSGTGIGTAPYNLLLNPYGGTVGIATNASFAGNSALQVYGNVAIGIQTYTGSPSLYVSNVTTTSNGSIGLQTGGGSMFHLTAYYSGGNSWMGLGGNGATAPTQGVINITNGGNVGIGTTSPSYTLDVNGQSRIGNPALITDASTVLRFTTNGGVSYIQSGTALTSYSVADIIFSGIFGNPEFMRIKSTGNVGIGTPSPGSTLTVNGSLSKSSGTFDIPHPTLPEPKRLVHSFIEGPRCDLMYRGFVALVNGTATVNIDSDCTSNAAHTMTQGTFEALCTNPVCFLQNDDSFDRVKGKVSGNLLTITCENAQSSDVVNWMVVAERKDLFIKQWNRTDPNGFLIPEYDSAS